MGMKEYYESAVTELKTFCEENTRFLCEIVENVYPIEVRFTPSASQLSLFPNLGADENGEIGYISVFCGVEPTVKIGLKLTICNSLLKKLISKAENVGKLYLHYKCEEVLSNDKQDSLEEGEK